MADTLITQISKVSDKILHHHTCRCNYKGVDIKLNTAHMQCRIINKHAQVYRFPKTCTLLWD